MRTETGVKRMQTEGAGVWQQAGVKTVHWNKLFVILSMKWRTQFSKNFITMPLFSVGLTFVMTLFYGSMAESNGNAEFPTVKFPFTILIHHSKCRRGNL